MSLTPYRSVLSRPGVLRLLLFGVLARGPLAASAIVMTLHVVQTLHLGYAAAGLVGTASTVGMAVGSPWRGRVIDRKGLRRALLPCVVVGSAVWAAAPFVPYSVLLLLAAVGGLMSLPVFGVIRQALAVMVPGGEQRSAYALDAVSVELSFIIGPTAGVLLATTLPTAVAVLAVGACTTAAGVALMVVDPPTRSDAEPPPLDRRAPGLRSWFSPGLAAVLVASVAATVVLAGTDVAIVASLREQGALALTGLLFTAWGGGSIVGGLVFGLARQRVSPFLLLLGLGLLTVPVGLAGSAWVLAPAILPAALLCAPTLTATAENVSRLVPEQVRGEAMGWHGSALTTGSALGAPLSGAVIDATGPWAGFACVGALGATLGVGGLMLLRVRSARRAAAACPVPAAG